MFGRSSEKVLKKFGIGAEASRNERQRVKRRMRHAHRAYSNIACRRARAVGHVDRSLPNAVSSSHDQYAPPTRKRVESPSRKSPSND